MESNSPPIKEKKRNSERKKEKSRDAARNRRSRESEIFSKLSEQLPLPIAVVKHLDKASIMRLAITHLRVRDILGSVESLKELPKEEKEDALYLPAIGGFVLVLSRDGDLLYISNNVSAYLGVSQVDLLGQSIYDVSHPCDHSELRDLLSGKGSTDGPVSFFMRMKSTLSNKSRNVILKSASYKVLKTCGRFIRMNENCREKYFFLALASPIPHPIDVDIPLGSQTFLSKHSLDMKFTYADEKMKDFLGYNPEKLIGTSMYEYHHVHDNKNIDKAFKSLFEKGQSETGVYRFLTQDGGFLWVMTQATVIHSEKTSKPESVVCVNYVVSEKCNEDEIFSLDQLQHQRNSAKPLVKTPVDSSAKSLNSLKTELYHSPRPQPATAKIFAPRTADMNKGFLIFSDDDSGRTIMKDEPEDLTHLAPTAGDVCVPLCEPPFREMIKEFLQDDGDPLINCQKDTFFSSYNDDLSCSSHSPSLSHSPGSCSVPSLIGLGDDSSTLEDSTMKTLLSLAMPESDLVDISSKSFMSSLRDTDELPYLMPPLELDLDALNTTNSAASDSSSPIPLSHDSDIPNLVWLTTDCDGKLDDVSQMMFINDEPERRKRLSSIGPDDVKKRKQVPVPDDGGGNSVLKNLLVSGRDINAGYICLEPRRSNSRSGKSES